MNAFAMSQDSKLRWLGFFGLAGIFYTFGPDYITSWPNHRGEEKNTYEWIILVTFHLYWLAIFAVGMFCKGKNNLVTTMLFASTATIEYALYMGLEQALYPDRRLMFAIFAISTAPFFLIAYYRVQFTVKTAKLLGRASQALNRAPAYASVKTSTPEWLTGRFSIRQAAYNLVCNTRTTELDLLVIGIAKWFMLLGISISLYLYAYAYVMDLGPNDSLYYTIKDNGHLSYQAIEAIGSNILGVWWLIIAFHILRLERDAPDAIKESKKAV